MGNIHEMAARLRELQDMRVEDPQAEGLRSGSPTEVMDVDSDSEPETQMSPPEALRQLVDGMKQEKKKEAIPAEDQLGSDAHGMGLSEVQKLKFKVPKELDAMGDRVCRPGTGQKPGRDGDQLPERKCPSTPCHSSSPRREGGGRDHGHWGPAQPQLQD